MIYVIACIAVLLLVAFICTVVAALYLAVVLTEEQIENIDQNPEPGTQNPELT